MNSKIFIGLKDISWSYFIKYFKTRKSLFRIYQYLLLEKYGKKFDESVIELGGENHYQHFRFFPNARKYTCTNIGRDYDKFLDITNMEFGDNSQDAYICLSVLEHVPDIQKALLEINRTLKPGGKLLLVVPFALPFHDTVDFWRMSETAYVKNFSNFDIVDFIHLGGIFSTTINMFQRPKGKITLRYLIYKIIGAMLFTAGKFLEYPDKIPIGYGIYAVKK